MSRRVYQPSGLTPHPSPKKRRWTGQRTGGRTPCQTLMDPGSLAANLSFHDTGHKKPLGWDEAEVAALVEYVALHHTVLEGKDWPSTHDDTFWGKCAEFVANKTGKAERTSTACRSNMNRLKKKHPTLHEAEELYNIRYTDLGQKENQPAATTTTSKSPATSLAEIQSEFHNLTPAQQWDCLDNLFRHKLEAMKPSLPVFVPRDFLKLSAAAMNTLNTNKRENTLFHLASALGTPREDGSGPRMPVDRMPFPMIEYNAKFFHVDHPDLVRCPSEYSTYMETMYAHFGKKWANLHCGPRWLGGTEEEEEEVGEEEGESEKAEKRNLLKRAGCKEVDLLAEAMKELGSSLDVEPLPDGDQLPAEAMREDGDSLGVEPLPAEVQLHAETSASPSSTLPWLEQENWAQDLYPSHLSAISPSPCPALTSTPIKSKSTTQRYSFLFSSASQAERRELQEGLPAEELQRMHNIRPAEQRKSRDRLKTMDAKVNIAGLSDRTLRRKIAKAPFDTTASIQVSFINLLSNL
ncbi:PREDICTED: uncharacterized protein LOC109481594 [Branchiostoma belcheri]|uniref:Uncharacterized protein LOC109481594 n=1 Tax=Branchiostoma belcheri TaxID=7741 RepID=A0A6P4ZEP2_BRABE|nr:PREDICTED: uncharacterized protein LOC109481594 [Branchiostoma belcheri]